MWLHAFFVSRRGVLSSKASAVKLSRKVVCAFHVYGKHYSPCNCDCDVKQGFVRSAALLFQTTDSTSTSRSTCFLSEHHHAAETGGLTRNTYPVVPSTSRYSLVASQAGKHKAFTCTARSDQSSGYPCIPPTPLAKHDELSRRSFRGPHMGEAFQTRNTPVAKVQKEAN